MALLGPFDRPVAVRVPRTVPRSQAPYVPPHGGSDDPAPVHPDDRSTRLEIARFLAYALLADSSAVSGIVPRVAAIVDEHVVVWSPCIFTTSRSDLIAALSQADDALTDVSVSIDGKAMVADSTVCIEWRFEGRFSNATFLNSDVLVEPSGDRVETSGAVVVTFADGVRASRIHCYYDALGLLEQMLGGGTSTADETTLEAR